jgi:hypothetical protein
MENVRTPSDDDRGKENNTKWDIYGISTVPRRTYITVLHID